MKRENANIAGWITLLVDLLSMLAAFYLSAGIRGGILRPGYLTGIYGDALIVLILSIIIMRNISNNNKNILKRGFWEELISILKDQGKIGFILLSYMFATQEGSEYSRIFFTLFFGLNILNNFVARSYMKLIMLVAYKRSSSSSKVMLVTISKNAKEVIRRIRKEYEWQIYVTTIALWDKDRIGEKIEGISVIANKDNLFDRARSNVVDVVFIHLPFDYNIDLEEIILEFEK
ncbi:MAG: nucleoside-diphosphate sugar epimerase/dehydratase, partial [Mobilitalea sp.]